VQIEVDFEKICIPLCTTGDVAGEMNSQISTNSMEGNEFV